ncbi:MAG TPA: hypothetical protein PKD45_07290 [Flavobacteriales bacterium]|nr:hypothetical protein [Flavobacteriales bacterium]
MFRGARILVAPLDWGLGHAARCVPIIRALLELDAVPIIGADKGPLALLRDEFPDLEHVRLPGMEVRYAAGNSQAWAMARQLPRMLRQVRQEHRLFATIRQQLRLQAVISDQRFGLRADDLPSVLITHQIFPFSPFAQAQARRINLRHIGRFHRCWIPDHAEAPGLAGELSHGPQLPANAQYIGPLSRFMGPHPPEGKPTWRTVAVISGPEPQRAQFEQAVTGQLGRIHDGLHLIIPGRIDVGTQRLLQLPTDELHATLLGTDLIISRTGYSTLMDLEVLGRGALLVPTPGQPEQEYLGRLHAAKGRHVVQRQDGLDIASVLQNPPPSGSPAAKSDALFNAMADLARLIDPFLPSSASRA